MNNKGSHCRNVRPWVHSADVGYSANMEFLMVPADSPRPYMQLASRCINPDPKSRPEFGEIELEIKVRI